MQPPSGFFAQSKRTCRGVSRLSYQNSSLVKFIQFSKVSLIVPKMDWLFPSWIAITWYIIFQFESCSSVIVIRMKMNEELVAWRDLGRWQWITTIWISQYGWCIWTTIIDCQWIFPEKKINLVCVIKVNQCLEES